MLSFSFYFVLIFNFLPFVQFFYFHPVLFLSCCPPPTPFSFVIFLMSCLILLIYSIRPLTLFCPVHSVMFPLFPPCLFPLILFVLHLSSFQSCLFIPLPPQLVLFISLLFFVRLFLFRPLSMSEVSRPVPSIEVCSFCFLTSVLFFSFYSLMVLWHHPFLGCLTSSVLVIFIILPFSRSPVTRPILPCTATVASWTDMELIK